MFAAGVAAGGINTVVGSGSLITFPTLVTLGFPPVVANVSNNIGLVPGSTTGAYGYRAELKGQRGRLLRLGSASLIGAVIGGLLLLGLPAGKGSSARLLNRDDARAAIAAALHEVLGVRFDVRAEERDGLETPEEPLLPEAEVIRRVVQEFEAQEVSDA